MVAVADFISANSGYLDKSTATTAAIVLYVPPRKNPTKNIIIYEFFLQN